jgi:hypothetical protein
MTDTLLHADFLAWQLLQEGGTIAILDDGAPLFVPPEGRHWTAETLARIAACRPALEQLTDELADMEA